MREGKHWTAEKSSYAPCRNTGGRWYSTGTVSALQRLLRRAWAPPFQSGQSTDAGGDCKRATQKQAATVDLCAGVQLAVLFQHSQLWRHMLYFAQHEGRVHVVRSLAF